MGDIANWTPPPDEAPAYARLIQKMDEIYPENWRFWVVNRVDYEDLFGRKISADEECRLRFAIPTEQLAFIFNDGTTTLSLSERKYKAIKRTLLKWPIGRAIIYAPFPVMKMVHPTDAFNGFAELLPNMKGKLISRTEASKKLRSVPLSSSHSVSQSVSPSVSPTTSYSRKRPRESDDRIEGLMEHQTLVLEQLLQAMTKKPRATATQIEPEEVMESGPEEDEPVEDQWTAPPILRESIQGDEPCENMLEENNFFDFSPQTKETEAKIGDADERLAQQGISVQRLGGEKWQQIRYVDVQKHFQATPVFTSLKVNSSLASISPTWQTTQLLEKYDQCLAAITHGLLQQRQHFTEAYKDASLEVKANISKKFLAADSEFRKTSDALLQYTCGKRAEVLQHRRGVFKPNNKILNELLHDIPPSATHLFSEPQLSTLIKDQGGVQKFFPTKFRKYANPFNPRVARTPTIRQQTPGRQRLDEIKKFSARPGRPSAAPARTTRTRPLSSTGKTKKPRFDGRKF